MEYRDGPGVALSAPPSQYAKFRRAQLRGIGLTEFLANPLTVIQADVISRKFADIATLHHICHSEAVKGAQMCLELPLGSYLIVHSARL
jgi:hypothetical protein